MTDQMTTLRTGKSVRTTEYETVMQRLSLLQPDRLNQIFNRAIDPDVRHHPVVETEFFRSRHLIRPDGGMTDGARQIILAACMANAVQMIDPIKGPDRSLPPLVLPQEAPPTAAETPAPANEAA